jgi:hypothetical protein
VWSDILLKGGVTNVVPIYSACLLWFLDILATITGTCVMWFLECSVDEK